jgi:4-hydroxybenzoate polyprenyltransferase
VTAVSGLLALSAGRGWGTLWTVAAIGTGQLVVGWSNDYWDRDRDRAAGRHDKPVATGAVPASTVRAAALGALVACVPLSLASGAASAAVHFVALACALAYNAGLKARPASVLPYAVAFGLLPAVVSLGLPDHHWPSGWVLAAGALIGSGAHFTQVLPDIAMDRRHGILGLPQVLGERTSAIAAALLLFGAMLAVTFGPGRPGPIQWIGLAATTGLTVAILSAVAAGRLRLSFRLTLLVAAVAVTAFVVGGRHL